MNRLVRLRADRWRAAFLVLAVVHLVVKAVMFLEVRSVPLTGDGALYADAGRAVAESLRRLVSGDGLDVGMLERNVVGMGWFMPGMTLVQAPLFVVAPHASDALVHAYNGVLISLLLLLSAYVVGRILGPAYGCALLVFPGLLPMWLLFSYQGFGDAPAGLLIVVLIALMVDHARRMRSGTTPSLRAWALFGLLLAITLYLRSSALPLVGGLLVLAAIAVVGWLRGPQRRRGLAGVALGGFVFVALLAPWSFVASHTLHGRVITTSTLPLSKAYAFGDRENLCFGPCRGSDWFAIGNYSRQVARATGVSELEVQKQMASYATRGVTIHSYARDVGGDFDRYVLSPSGMIERFESGVPSSIEATNRGLSDGAYYLVGLVALVSLLWPRRRSPDNQVLLLLASATTAALMLQPFVHVCSARYWPVFAPLMALAAVLLVQDLRRPRVALDGADKVVSRWLLVLQVLVSVGVATVAAALGVLAVS